jgi:hypothetical protein
LSVARSHQVRIGCEEWEYRWRSAEGRAHSCGPSIEKLSRTQSQSYDEEKRGGEVEVRFVPPLVNWKWSLAHDEEWTQTYTRERPVARETFTVTASCRAQRDKVTVSAGTFDAIKVTCTNAQNRRTLWERWYAPAVKSFVKDVPQLPDGKREQELIRTNVSP